MLRPACWHTTALPGFLLAETQDHELSFCLLHGPLGPGGPRRRLERIAVAQLRVMLRFILGTDVTLKMLRESEGKTVGFPSPGGHLTSQIYRGSERHDFTFLMYMQCQVTGTLAET